MFCRVKEKQVSETLQSLTYYLLCCCWSTFGECAPATREINIHLDTDLCTHSIRNSFRGTFGRLCCCCQARGGNPSSHQRQQQQQQGAIHRTQYNKSCHVPWGALEAPINYKLNQLEFRHSKHFGFLFLILSLSLSLLPYQPHLEIFTLSTHPTIHSQRHLQPFYSLIHG